MMFNRARGVAEVASIDTWRMLEQVLPAPKKAGVEQCTVFETLVGDQA